MRGLPLFRSVSLFTVRFVYIEMFNRQGLANTRFAAKHIIASILIIEILHLQIIVQDAVVAIRYRAAASCANYYPAPFCRPHPFKISLREMHWPGATSVNRFGATA